jgi:hypothetical protein
MCVGWGGVALGEQGGSRHSECRPKLEAWGGLVDKAATGSVDAGWWIPFRWDGRKMRRGLTALCLQPANGVVNTHGHRLR